MKWLVTAVLVCGVVAVAGHTAHADYNSEYRKSCKILTKYRLRVWAGCTSDKSYGKTAFDKGCGYAACFITDSCSVGVGVANIRIGQGAVNKSYSKGQGWYKPGIGPQGIAVSPTRYTASAYAPKVAFDSVAQTITLTLDSLRIVATNDSSYSLIDVRAWIATSDSDSVISIAKTYWTANVRLQAGVLYTTGGFSQSDFALTHTADSTWITATHLVKVIPFTQAQSKAQKGEGGAAGPGFENAVLQVIDDGSYGAVAVLPVVGVSPWAAAGLAVGLLGLGTIFARMHLKSA